MAVGWQWDAGLPAALCLRRQGALIAARGAEGLDALRDSARAADGIGNSYRLILPVAEYRASDGDLYVAQWVEVTGPGHPAGDPILSVMQVRDGRVVRQFDTTPPFSWAAEPTE